MKKYLRDILILSVYLSGLATVRRRTIKKGLTPLTRVICFHRVDRESIPSFIKKLLWLKARCNIITLQDLESQDELKSDRLNVAITFDDGFRDFLTNVFPILTDLKVPATLFVPSGFVGLDHKKALEFARARIGIPGEVGLDTTELRCLAQSELVTIGSHGRAHIDLASENSINSLKREIIGSKRDLETIIESEIRYFAYPFGNRWNCNERCFEVLDASGYRMAFTIVPGFNRPNAHRWTMHRDSLSPKMPSFLFRAWLEGAYDRFKYAIDYARGYRLVENGQVV